MIGGRALRALLRVELRQLVKHPKRSLLILLLIGVPVAAIVAGATLARVSEPTPQERAQSAMGAADLRIDGIEEWADRQKVASLLPPDAVRQPVFAGLERVTTPGRSLPARLYAVPASALESGGVALDMVRVNDGRPPRNPAEVALSGSLLNALEAEIGDTVALTYGTSRTIVGQIDDPEDLDLPLVVRTPARVEYPSVTIMLVSLPTNDGHDSIAKTLREAGFGVQTRSAAEVRDGTLAALVFLLGGAGLVEAALVICAAFAISLRRRQIEIGLLGATGATRRGITSALVAATAVLALVAGIVGSLVGIGSAAIVHPFLDSLLDRHVGPFEVMPGDVVLGIVLGIVAAIFAAYLPARAAAALPPREALGKRRPAAHPSRRWLVIGLLLAALGVAILVVSQRVSTPIAAVALLLGPVLGLIGFGACSPWLLGWLAKRAARLPLAWRLAVRDAGRFRARDGAVVTAVLAGMSMSVTIAALVTSVDHKVGPFPSSYRDDQMLVEGPGADDVAPKIAEELSAIAVAPLQAAYLRGEPVRGRVGGEFRLGLGEWVAVGDAELLRALGADRVGTTHDRSRLVVLDIEDLANVGAETTTVELTTWVGGDIIDTPDITFVRTSQFVREPLYFVDRAALETLGWRASAPPNRTLVPWVVRLDRAVTSKHLSQAREIAAASVRTSVDANLLHLNPTRGAYLSVLLLSVVTGLVVVLIATSLSAAESSGDARILRTVGAAPRLLRLHLAARAAYLSLLGCLLAVPAGLVVAIGIFASADIPLDFIMPWSHLLTIVGVLPVLVYVATWCLQPPKTELRPRLAS